MNRNSSRILSISEFSSREGDAGVALGSVLYSHSDTYTVHRFHHFGGRNAELIRYWGHYDMGLKQAYGFYCDTVKELVDSGYQPIPPSYWDDDFVYEACRRLAKLLEDAGVDPSSLDEAIHEIYSEAASVVNNGGFYNQIESLIRQIGLEYAEDKVHELIAVLREGYPEPE